MVTQPFVSQLETHMRELVNYFLIDVAQVYKVYMILGTFSQCGGVFETHIVLLSWLITVDVW